MKKICDNCHAEVEESADKCPMCGFSKFSPGNFKDLPAKEQEQITQSKYGYDKSHVFAISMVSAFMFVVSIINFYHALSDSEHIDISALMSSIFVFAGGCYFQYIALSKRRKE